MVLILLIANFRDNIKVTMYSKSFKYSILSLIILGIVGLFLVCKHIKKPFNAQEELISFTLQFNIKLPKGVIPIEPNNKCGFWSPYPSFSFAVTDNQISELENTLSQYGYGSFKIEDIQMSNCYSRFNTTGSKVLVSENNQNLSIAKYLVYIPKDHLLEAIYFDY